MMNRRVVSTVALVVLLMLPGCAGPQIWHTQLVVLDKGMDPSTTEQRLQLPPLSVHSIDLDDRRYTFHRYRMNNGITHALYLLAFEDNRLVYWGYVDDFRRHPDAALNSAIDRVMPHVHAAIAKEKAAGKAGS